MVMQTGDDEVQMGADLGRPTGVADRDTANKAGRVIEFVAEDAVHHRHLECVDRHGTPR
jgi:hypothetical protein